MTAWTAPQSQSERNSLRSYETFFFSETVFCCAIISGRTVISVMTPEQHIRGKGPKSAGFVLCCIVWRILWLLQMCVCCAICVLCSWKLKKNNNKKNRDPNLQTSSAPPFHPFFRHGLPSWKSMPEVSSSCHVLLIRPSYLYWIPIEGEL